MQIFEITAKKLIQEAINPGAAIGALGAKLAAYNAQQAGLSMPMMQTVAVPTAI
jgi:hypothetical protein